MRRARFKSFTTLRRARRRRRFSARSARRNRIFLVHRARPPRDSKRAPLLSLSLSPPPFLVSFPPQPAPAPHHGSTPLYSLLEEFLPRHVASPSDLRAGKFERERKKEKKKRRIRPRRIARPPRFAALGAREDRTPGSACGGFCPPPTPHPPPISRWRFLAIENIDRRVHGRGRPYKKRIQLSPRIAIATFDRSIRCATSWTQGRVENRLATRKMHIRAGAADSCVAASSPSINSPDKTTEMALDALAPPISRDATFSPPPPPGS